MKIPLRGLPKTTPKTMQSKPQFTLLGFPVKFVGVDMAREMTPTQKLFYDWFNPQHREPDDPQDATSKACPRCGVRMRRYRTLSVAVWRDCCKHCGWRN